jgi:hypothetical protein
MKSRPILRRLVNMYFVNHSKKGYTLHSSDSNFALSQIPTVEQPGTIDRPTGIHAKAASLAGCCLLQPVKPELGRVQNLEISPSICLEFELLCRATEF